MLRKLGVLCSSLSLGERVHTTTFTYFVLMRFILKYPVLQTHPPAPTRANKAFISQPGCTKTFFLSRRVNPKANSLHGPPARRWQIPVRYPPSISNSEKPAPRRARLKMQLLSSARLWGKESGRVWRRRQVKANTKQWQIDPPTTPPLRHFGFD